MDLKEFILIYTAKTMCYMKAFFNAFWPSLNSLTLGRYEWNFSKAIFELNLVIDGWCISCGIALRWLSLNLTDGKSILVQVQVMAWCRQATSRYLGQCWPRPMLPYGVTRPQWVNSLWPSDATWRHRSGWTLTQVMACCLMAPSHYLH